MPLKVKTIQAIGYSIQPYVEPMTISQAKEFHSIIETMASKEVEIWKEKTKQIEYLKEIILAEIDDVVTAKLANKILEIMEEKNE